MKRLQTYFIVTISLLVSLLGGNETLAVAAETPVLKQAQVVTYDEQVLTANKPVTTSLRLASDEKVEQARIALKIKTSPTIQPEKGFVTISLNGQKLTSAKLTPGKVTSVAVDVPSHLFKTENTLEMTAFLKSTDLVCEPTDDVNWAVLEAPSQFTYTIASTPKIAQWTKQMQTDNHFSIVMPENPTAFNEEQLLNITTLIEQKQVQAVGKPTMTIETKKDWDRKQKHLFIGTIEQIVAQFPKAFSKEAQAEYRANGGIEYLFVDNQWQLVLMSETPAQLKTLLTTLQFADLTQQLQTQRYVLKDVSQRQLAPLPLSGTLADLNYQDQKVTGFGKQSLYYYIPTPLRQEVSEATFTFAIRASELLDWQSSFVDILVNGERLKTVAFEAGKAVQLVSVQLPEQIIRQGVFTISLDFQLEALNMDCETKPQTQLWASVDSEESTYHLKMRPRATYTMASRAAALQNEAGLASGVVAYDQNLLSLSQLSEIVRDLAGQARGLDYITVTDTQTVPKTHGLVIGDSHEAFMQQLTQEQPYALLDDGTIAGDESFLQIATELSQIHLRQAEPQLLIVAPSRTEMEATLTYYERQQLPLKAENIALKAGEVVQTTPQQSEQAPVSTGFVMKKDVVIPLVVTGTLLLSTCAIAIWYRYRRNKR